MLKNPIPDVCTFNFYIDTNSFFLRLYYVKPRVRSYGDIKERGIDKDGMGKIK